MPGYVLSPSISICRVKHKCCRGIEVVKIKRCRSSMSCSTPFSIPLFCIAASWQMNEAATEGDLCQFVMRSYRSFEQAVYQNVVDHRSTSCGPRGDRELSGDIASADPVGEDLLSGSRPHYLAFLIREGAGSHSSGILDMMTMMTRQHSRQFQQIEHAADR